jgi:hypothetical protein
MARLFMFLFVAHIALAATALIGCLSAEKGEVRALPRSLWVLIIVFLPVVGPVAWLLAGRPVGPDGRDPRSPSPRRRRPGPVAPDDNPDFLRSLGGKEAERDRELFQRWEDDLRKREDEMRRKQSGEPPREDNHPEG